ncbi:unnamed protein product [Cyberlindnera jadinii]|uniref:Cell wall mannoprotein PIR1-like C-terminal domain-containing protein n=1 Tax=Cyberlindnera jadinii (strain ATCC 18201 / CBS 1600 / BCRC 20928 / JCM 3617 / NBRC 0987 / NRRL Y-1542) TaxID=983966 RepID=A0A0H5CIK9_CYBJN|nr:unnamed protein product [Cyberlindnera jadinii]
MKFHIALISLAVAVCAEDASSTWTTLTPSASPIGTTNYEGPFGIAVEPVESQSSTSDSTTTLAKRDVISQISDGQIQATTSTKEAVSTAQAVSQIGDGQIQATTSTKQAVSTAQAVSQIGDGQIQATTSTKQAVSTAQAVSQIGDGQIQATTSTKEAVSTAQAVSQIGDGQIQATTSTKTTADAVSQISDGQVQATTTSSSTTKESKTSTDSSEESKTSSDAAEESSELDITAVSCKTDGTLQMSLEDSILYDSNGRVGSIVANRQFQFDGPPPQAGAIYAAGWSITDDGYLALGDSDIFYQCLSGTFYNLYDESIGGQCTQIRLEVVRLIDC